MKVNLWDSNFSQSVCSVAWAVPEHIEYVRGVKQWDGVTLFTDSWINNPIVDEVQSTYKLAWLREPGCLWPEHYKFSTDWLKFNLLLSYRKDFIFDYSTTFVPYCGVWIPRSEWGLHPKTKLVSMLFGEKRSTYGHQLRHLIGEMFPRQIDYFGFRGEKVNYSPETKVRVHKDYMFSVVIETCREDWLFTEILLDCFALGTIPIFWGCPGIGAFFDDRGIIQFETLPELRAILPQLTPSLFRYMRPFALENLKRVAEYAVTEDWMYQNVLRRFE